MADAVFAFTAIDAGQRSDGARFARQPDACHPGDVVISTGDSALWEGCDPGIADAVQQALKELGDKGVRISSTAMPEVQEAIQLLRGGGVGEAEFDEFLTSELPEWRETLDPLVSQRILNAGSLPAVEYLRRRRLIGQLQQSAPQRFEECDVIASPTVPITQPKLEDVSEEAGYGPLNLMSLRNTCAANVLGLCSITLPVGLDAAGMPVGLQLLAPHNGEDKLLSVALCIEGLIGNSNDRLGKPPAISS